MSELGHSRWGQVASKPGHVRYAAEAESKHSPGERSEIRDHVEMDLHIAESVTTVRAQLRSSPGAQQVALPTWPTTMCELLRVPRKGDLDMCAATNQPDGQITKSLSSYRRKNIPLNLSGKSAA